MADDFAELGARASRRGLRVGFKALAWGKMEFRQTNSESELIDRIHEATNKGTGILINPAAFTFFSMAVMDAVKMFTGPLINFTS